MSRPKPLSVLAGVIAALALSATPAFAEFQSTAKPAQSQGNVTFLKSANLKIGTIEIKCPVKDIKAQYHIQAKGQIKQEQTATTKGPRLNIQVKSLGKECTAVILGEKTLLEVKPCDFQIVQRQTTIASGGLATPCLFKIGESKAPICELQIPAGMETKAESNQGINVGLKESILANSGTNLIVKTKITEKAGGMGQLGEGIFAVQIPGHPLCPVSTNEKTTEEVELEMEGLNA